MSFVDTPSIRVKEEDAVEVGFFEESGGRVEKEEAEVFLRSSLQAGSKDPRPRILLLVFVT